MFALRLFGGLSLESSDGQVPPGVLQRRRLTLLTLLAVGGSRGVARAQLQAHLWPDKSDDRARHALEQLLYLTRRDLARDVILANTVALRLNPEIITSDLAAFDEALAGGDLATAVRIYASPLLDGVRLAGTPELERWVDEQRDACARRYASALDRLAAAAERAGDHAHAAEWWRRRVVLDPYSSVATLGLMRALTAAGDYAAAVRQARVYETLVRDDLALQPDSAVASLAARLAAQLLESAPEASDGNAARVPIETSPKAPIASGAASSVGGPPSAGPDHIAPTFETARRRRRPPLRALALAATVTLAVALPSDRTSPRPDGPPTGERPTTLPSIAVLPLADLSAGRENNFFGDGLTEELIHALSRVPELRVVARTSVFALKERPGDVRQIARTLGATAVLEGSVRRVGDRVHVNVRLVDATTGYERWSESYDRRLVDVLAVQREIAGAVTNRLSSGSPGTRVTRDVGGADTRSYTAFEHYLRGRYFLNKGGAAALTRAVDELRAAIAGDSRYARAHAALAEAYNGLAEGSGGHAAQATLLARAEESAARAVGLDPHLAEAHASLGDFHMNRWDWPAAAEAFRRALSENPSLARAHERYGILLALQGQFDEAVALAYRAQELDPLSLRIQGTTAYVLNLARRYPAAEAVARRLVTIDSTRESPRFRLGSVLLQQGRYAEAVHELEAALLLPSTTQNRALPLLGYAYERAGRTADAKRLRPLIERGLADLTVSPYFAAAYFAAVGERDRAFEVLADLGSRRESCLRDLAVDPIMDPLHADPRFARVLHAIGVEPPTDRGQ